MSNIPTEVVESCILPRLPVKSLVRFKCVSKSWKTLISSSEFLRLQHRHANRLLVTSVDGNTLLEVHNLDSPLDPPFLCPHPDLEQLYRFRQKTTILASCEFFVLVGGYFAPHRVERLFLVNPSTLSYQGIIVQRGFNRRYVKYGLYFDEANDDCKVVRISDFDLRNDQYSWKVEIYSCKINKWRLIEDKLIITSSPFDRMESDNSVACLNNLLYLITDPAYGEQRIHCFDIQAERWTNYIVYPNELLYLEICVLNGSLCVLGIDTSNDEDLLTQTYSVWVFNESDSFKETWVKLMSIVSKNCVEYHPIAYRKGSQHELLCQQHYGGCELFWYDLKHKVATKPQGFNVVARHNSHYHLCKESLITFHGRLFGA